MSSSRFLSSIKNRNIQILILYRGLRNIICMGSGLFAFFVLSFLSATPMVLGLMISAGFLAAAMGSILGGYLTSKIGKRYTLVFSSLSAGFGWIALSLSRDWTYVAFSYGLTNGMMVCAFPAENAIVSDSVSGELGGGLGIMNTVTSIVSSIGSFLGALIARYLGFELLFATMALPWFLSVYPISRIEERKLGEAKKPFKLGQFNPFYIVKQNPSLFILSSSVLLVTIGGYAGDFYPDYVKEMFNITPIQIGIFDSIYSIIWATTNYPMGLLSDKVGRKKVIVLGYTLMGLAWLLFPVPHSLFWLFALYAVYCLGNSMGFFTTALAMDITSDEDKGTAIGIFNGFMYTGVFLSGILGGILWENMGALTSFRISFITFMAVASIIGFEIKSISTPASE